MPKTEPDIIYEDAHILVCRKPAGVATQTKNLREKDMESILKNYLKSPELYLLHRLDQPVEGILLSAKTKEAAALCGRRAPMEKRYYAVALLEDRGLKEDGKREHGERAGAKELTLEDFLVRDGRNNMSAVVKEGEKGAKRAELSLRILKTGESTALEGAFLALAEIRLKTGRHHQIRVQVAHAGMPLLGDLKYGSERSVTVSRLEETENIALCACRLSFAHPITGKKMEFCITPEGRAFRPFLPVNP